MLVKLNQDRVNITRIVKHNLFYVLIFWLISGCQGGVNTTTPILPGGINSNSPEEHPNYSNDGRYLVFASDRRGQRDIFLYDFEQNGLVDLPNLNHGNSSQDQPAISNDGRYIVYLSTERGKTDIFIYDRQTQRSDLLTGNIKGSVRNPTISGDGTKVAFQSSQLGQWKIVLLEINR